jgi:hypothetical protein
MPENKHDRPAVFSCHAAIGREDHKHNQQAMNDRYCGMVDYLASISEFDPRIHNTVICRPTGAGPSRLSAADRIRMQPFF